MSQADQQVLSILGEAVEMRSPAERAAYLDQACAGDSERRARVEALLRAYDAAGHFLQGDHAFPSEGGTVDDPLTERPGTMIGPYKLQELIGEGGMGLVFVAEQEKPIRRRVAVKVIKPGMDSKQVIARFEAERQALAMMDHPNIAHVFDAGTTDSGRPYFVMELVKGVPVTQYCDQNRLTTRQRLELFVPVCQAVQHAHQKGIIHRDLKPSNVLVTVHDVTPVVKIIDFGIAKAMGPSLTDRSVYTGLSQLIGTPLYMSPEQAGLSGLDVDTRSDVYSLGVLLYELLTGTTPFDAETLKRADFDEMRRIIREDEPPRPSTRLSTLQAAALSTVAERHGVEPRRLSQQVRGELDWIVMKCLEKDRNRRYETANALARDIERYLHDETVEACPPSATYRVRKFLRKHRAAVLATTAATMVLLLTVAGLAVSNWLIRQEQEQTRQERDRAEEARKAEVKRRELARRALTAMSSNVIYNWLGQQKELLPEHKDFLKHAVAWYEELAADTADDESTRVGLAEAHHTVAFIRSQLGEGAEAESALRQAHALYAQLVADFPIEPKYQFYLAAVTSHLGTMLNNASLLNNAHRWQEAEQAFDQELDLVLKLTRDYPSDPYYRYWLVHCLRRRGQLYAGWGQPAKTERAWRESLAVFAQLPTDYPTPFDYRLCEFTVRFYLGGLLHSAGPKEESDQQIQRALQLHAELVKMRSTESTSSRNLSVSPKAPLTLLPAVDFAARLNRLLELEEPQGFLGTYLLETGRLKEAAALYRQIVPTLEKKVAAFPAVPHYRSSLAVSLNNLGIVLGQTGEFAEAERCFRQELELAKRLVEEFPKVPVYRQGLLQGHQNLGNVLIMAGQSKEAEAAYHQAHQLAIELVRDFPKSTEYAVNLGGIRNNLGHLMEGQGQPAAALTWYDQAILTLKPVLQNAPQYSEARKTLSNTHERRATALVLLGRHAEAMPDWDRALELDDHRPSLRYGRAQTSITSTPLWRLDLTTRSTCSGWITTACRCRCASPQTRGSPSPIQSSWPSWRSIATMPISV